MASSMSTIVTELLQPSTSSTGVGAPTSSVKSVYQFKITLNKFKPPIWRRIQVPEDFTFKNFHKTIQSLMGWSGYHSHRFEVGQFKIQKPEILDEVVGGLGEIVEAESVAKIKDFFKLEEVKKGFYIYDFGSEWRHYILLEKILPAKANVTYPICITGRRKTPPEDPTEQELREYQSISGNSEMDKFIPGNVKLNFE